MVANGQSGPYSWWESQQFPNPGSPWAGTHPEAGNGASSHAWGIANANMVLLDSLAAQRSDGSLVVGRGVPDSWVSSGQVISLANFPTAGGRHSGLSIRTSGQAVTLTISGDQPAGAVLFQLPAFAGNIASASAGSINEKTGPHGSCQRSWIVTPPMRGVTIHHHGDLPRMIPAIYRKQRHALDLSSSKVQCMSSSPQTPVAHL